MASDRASAAILQDELSETTSPPDYSAQTESRTPPEPVDPEDSSSMFSPALSRQVHAAKTLTALRLARSAQQGSPEFPSMGHFSSASLTRTSFAHEYEDGKAVHNGTSLAAPEPPATPPRADPAADLSSSSFATPPTAAMSGDLGENSPSAQRRPTTYSHKSLSPPEPIRSWRPLVSRSKALDYAPSSTSDKPERLLERVVVIHTPDKDDPSPKVMLTPPSPIMDTSGSTGNALQTQTPTGRLDSWSEMSLLGVPGDEFSWQPSRPAATAPATPPQYELMASPIQSEARPSAFASQLDTAEVTDTYALEVILNKSTFRSQSQSPPSPSLSRKRSRDLDPICVDDDKEPLLGLELALMGFGGDEGGRWADELDKQIDRLQSILEQRSKRNFGKLEHILRRAQVYQSDSRM